MKNKLNRTQKKIPLLKAEHVLWNTKKRNTTIKLCTNKTLRMVSFVSLPLSHHRSTIDPFLKNYTYI